jgi:hypothetical protein
LSNLVDIFHLLANLITFLHPKSMKLSKSDTTGRAGGLICPLKAVVHMPPVGGAA